MRVGGRSSVPCAWPSATRDSDGTLIGTVTATHPILSPRDPSRVSSYPWPPGRRSRLAPRSGRHRPWWLFVLARSRRCRARSRTSTRTQKTTDPRHHGQESLEKIPCLDQTRDILWIHTSPDPIMTEFNIVHLIGIFLALFVTLKIAGTVLFWLLSYILGNKLAEMLEEDNGQPAGQRRPESTAQQPREADPDFSARRPRHAPTYED